MNKAESQSLIATPVIVAVGAAIAWAGSQGGATVGALPIFALCGILSFGLNWLVFVHAYLPTGGSTRWAPWCSSGPRVSGAFYSPGSGATDPTGASTRSS